MLKDISLLLIASAAVTSYGQTAQRNALVEDFSNEECHPCHAMSIEFHPALFSLDANDTGAHLNVIAYQLDFPGTDPSYNAHAQQRADFYLIGSLPAVRLNGNRGINHMLTQPDYYNLLDTSRNGQSSFVLAGTYTINTASQKLSMSVSAKSLSTLQGPYKIHTAVIERHYLSTSSSIGMNDYYFVMRRMFPDGNGRVETTWTANVNKQFQDSGTYQVTNPPAVGSFDFWGNPLMSDMIVFVQDTTTKEVLQSQIIKPSLPTGLQEPGRQIKAVVLYPNPADNVLSVAFDLSVKGNALIRIKDMTGKTVHERQAGELPVGRTAVSISTNGLPPGLYLLEVTSAEETSVRQLCIYH